MLHLESLRESIGSGPGVVFWRYPEPGGTPGIGAENPFAELGDTSPAVLYRRCFNIVRPPACRFPVSRFVEILPKFGVVILHNPEVFQDFAVVLPELVKACMGHNVRLVVVSEWRDFLSQCRDAVEPLADLLPVSTVVQ